MSVTAIIPTSVIPSHPHTDIIDETIESIKERIDCEIFILFDGVRGEQSDRQEAYDEYIRRMLIKTKDDPKIIPMVFKDFTHQALMTRKALEFIYTDAVLFVEHDTPLVGEIDFHDCMDALSDYNVIRFSHEAVIPNEHLEMMLGNYSGALKTVQWSQRPHLARTEFYRWILHQYFDGTKRSMIEDKMFGIIYNEFIEKGYRAWEKYKMVIYAPENAKDLRRSANLDGRKNDPKWQSEL